MSGNHILKGRWDIEAGRYDKSCNSEAFQKIETTVSRRHWIANLFMYSLFHVSDLPLIRNMLELGLVAGV